MTKNIIALFLMICLMPGCTTFHPVPTNTQTSREAIRPGDQVRVTARDGRVLDFTVQEFDERSISGEHVRLALSEISLIERREFSPAKTAGLLGLTAFLVTAFIFFSVFVNSGL